jgi:two-component system invasion response regulator UvrY
MINILIADDHAMVRKGLKVVLADQYPHAVIDFACTGEDTLHAIRSGEYNLLILDMNFPDMSSFSLFQQILVANSELKILIYTMNAEEVYALRYLQMGAFGYLEKSAPDADLIKAVQTILNGKRYFSVDVLDAMTVSYSSGPQPKNPFESLSVRELEICMYLVKGHGIGKISSFLNLHTSTVATQKTRIFKKVSVDSLIDLAELAKTYKIV